MRKRTMEIKEILLLSMFFSHLCVLALSSSPLHQETLPSDFVQDKTPRGEKTHEQSTIRIDGSDASKSAIKHSSKVQQGIGHKAANAGTRPNPSEAGSNGGTKTPSTQGGTTVIPVYAAGGANNRHPYHRGAANCNQIGASTLIAAATACVLHLYVVFGWG